MHYVSLKIGPRVARTLRRSSSSILYELGEYTGATIIADEDGTVIISSMGRACVRVAHLRLLEIFRCGEDPMVQEGIVEQVFDRYATVKLRTGFGTLHVAPRASSRHSARRYLSEGQPIRVRLICDRSVDPTQMRLQRADAHLGMRRDG